MAWMLINRFIVYTENVDNLLGPEEEASSEPVAESRLKKQIFMSIINMEPDSWGSNMRLDALSRG